MCARPPPGRSGKWCLSPFPPRFAKVRAFAERKATFIVLQCLTMSIDAYTPCPGGTGKKVKFCCGGDFLAELQKIDRMLEGQQFSACLHYLEGLLGKELARPRACLLATKCLLLRLTDQFEAARQVPGSFGGLSGQPNGPGRDGHFDRPRKRAGRLRFPGQRHGGGRGRIQPRTYSALGQVAAVMLYADFVLPALARCACRLTPLRTTSGAERIGGALPVAPVPLLLRDEPPLGNLPGDAPWKRPLIEAWQTASVGCWRTAAEQLAQLAAERRRRGLSGATWRRFAAGWPRTRALIEALRKYAALLRRSSRMGLTTPLRPKPRRCVFPTIRSAIDRTFSGWFGRSGMRTR